ncbi:MAG: hypothetical protein GWM88_14520 [Pseudomonadales bacterium]|nr:hypothetical protein [Pseudomonadales bacterium]NIX09153.1 hypothetical protein [Pseudomonadales bacterium]
MPEDHPPGDSPALPECVIFQPESFVPAADGTEICAFLNSSDTRSGPLRDPASQAVSVAAGRIGPGVRSAVHVHPVLTQITYVTAGTLTALMRQAGGTEAYRVEVPPGAATRTDCGTLLQLCNETEGTVEVLYVSAPAYILETAADGSVRYEDALMLGEDWDSPAVREWNRDAAEKARSRATSRRAEAARRIAEQAKR